MRQALSPQMTLVNAVTLLLCQPGPLWIMHFLQESKYFIKLDTLITIRGYLREWSKKQFHFDLCPPLHSVVASTYIRWKKEELKSLGNKCLFLKNCRYNTFTIMKIKYFLSMSVIFWDASIFKHNSLISMSTSYAVFHTGWNKTSTSDDAWFIENLIIFSN